MNGWDSSVLSRAVNTCTADSGLIQDCSVFQNEGRFYSDDEMNACSATDPQPGDVNTEEPVLFLPGCVAVTNGPANATAADLDPRCTTQYRRSDLESDDVDSTFARTAVPEEAKVNRLRRHRAMRGQWPHSSA
jgi:hypothetical protein